MEELVKAKAEIVYEPFLKGKHVKYVYTDYNFIEGPLLSIFTPLMDDQYKLRKLKRVEAAGGVMRCAVVLDLILEFCQHVEIEGAGGALDII